MAVFRAPGLKFQAFADTSTFGSGFTLYTYSAGTTTPQSTYTSNTGLTANTNPIVLNARGEAPYEIWLTGGAAYKFTLKSAAGVTLWTEDNVRGQGDTTVAISEWIPSGLAPNYISATSFSVPGDQRAVLPINRRIQATTAGGTRYGTIINSMFASGATTVTLTLDSGNLDSGLSAISYGILSSANDSYPTTGRISIQRHGAIADDATDATAAIQSAVNAAIAASTTELVAGGRVGAPTYSEPEVYFPPGKYVISDAIVYGPCLRVYGEGAILRQTNPLKDHFYCGGAASSNGYRVHVEGLIFLGGRSAFRLTGANIDTRSLAFIDNEFHTQNVTNYALSILCQTGSLALQGNKVLDSPLYLEYDGDKGVCDDKWNNGYLHSTGLKPNGTDSFKLSCREFQIKGSGVYVPESGAGTSTATRWVTQAIGTFVDIDGPLFGSEGSGGIPIVYSYGSADTTAYPFYTPSGVRLANSLLGTGNAGRADKGGVVLVDSVPGKLIFEECHGAVEAPLISDGIFAANYGGPVSDWLAAKASANGPKIGISLLNNNTYHVALTSLMPPALVPFTVAFIPYGGMAGSEFYAPLGSGLVTYLSSIADSRSRHEINHRGEKRPVTSGTAFDIINFTKTVNSGNSSAGIMGELLVMYVVEQAAGPVQAVVTKRYDIAAVAGRAANIAVTITSRGTNDVPAAALGDIIAVTLKAGATATAATLVCTITSGETGGCATWSFRQIGTTNNVATGRAFHAASA